MDRAALADKLLKEMVKTGYAPNLLSTLAIETGISPKTTFSLLKSMEDIHPGWYSIQRRFKLDIEVRVNFPMLPHVTEFLDSGGYFVSYQNNFPPLSKILPFNTVNKIDKTSRSNWISVAAILASLLFVAITWYIIRH